MNKILDDVKTSLGIMHEEEVFDQELIMFINAALMTLSQLGVGPAEGFRVETGEETWDAFITNDMLTPVKTSVYLRVRLLFDPPANNFLLEAMERQLAEVEWRLQTQKEIEEGGTNEL